MANCHHHPRHLFMVPFWLDVIAVKDHGVVCCLCYHIISPHSLVTPGGCCVSHHICHCIIVRCLLVILSSHPLVLLLRRLVVACCMPLSPYLLALPSCPLVVPAGCCMSCCLCHPILAKGGTAPSPVLAPAPSLYINNDDDRCAQPDCRADASTPSNRHLPYARPRMWPSGPAVRIGHD